MPITQETYWKTVCDGCEEAFPEHESGGGYTLSESEKDAREYVTDYDGEITKDGKIICPTCAEERRGERHGGDE
jgi:formylmethanofuran dehydrogenase subunit E